jgi:hypothetical protein
VLPNVHSTENQTFPVWQLVALASGARVWCIFDNIAAATANALQLNE